MMKSRNHSTGMGNTTLHYKVMSLDVWNDCSQKYSMNNLEKTMKQEDKDLLLQDLCGRLPYGVKCYKSTYKPELAEEVICMLRNGSHNCVQLGSFLYKLEHIKPYLFPLSSMTEEQYDSISKLMDNCSHTILYSGKGFTLEKIKTYTVELIDWLNANHFDYKGLIEKGLAIDATGLNIY